MVVGVRLTDGLNGTIVDRPSSPAIQIYTRSETIFILCGAAFFAAWMANGQLVEEVNGSFYVAYDTLNAGGVGVNSRTKTTVSTGISFGSALAIAISWSLHKSILWACIHGLLSWLYVIYYALTY